MKTKMSTDQIGERLGLIKPQIEYLKNFCLPAGRRFLVTRKSEEKRGRVIQCSALTEDSALKTYDGWRGPACPIMAEVSEAGDEVKILRAYHKER